MDKPECSGVAFQHVAVGFGAQWCKTCGAHPSELDRFYWFYWPIIPWHIFHQFSIRHLVSRWGSINKSTELLQFLERISNILFKKNVGHDEKKYKCWKSIFRIFFARWQEMCHHRGLVRFLFLKYFFTTSQTMPTTPLRWIIHHIVLVHVGCSYGGQTRRFKIQLSLGSLDFDVKLHHVPIRHSIGLKDFFLFGKTILMKTAGFQDGEGTIQFHIQFHTMWSDWKQVRPFVRVFFLFSLHRICADTLMVIIFIKNLFLLVKMDRHFYIWGNMRVWHHARKSLVTNNHMNWTHKNDAENKYFFVQQGW